MSGLIFRKCEEAIKQLELRLKELREMYDENKNPNADIVLSSEIKDTVKMLDQAKVLMEKLKPGNKE